MSSYEDVEDLGSVTVASSATEQTNRAEVGDVDTISVVLIGDSNSTDVDVNYMSAEASGLPLGDMQRGIESGNNFKRTNIDLTSYSNNKVVLEDIPAHALNQFAADITNNAASETTVEVKVAKRRAS